MTDSSRTYRAGQDRWLAHSVMGSVRGPRVEAVSAVLGTDDLVVVDTEFTPTHIVEIALSRHRRLRPLQPGHDVAPAGFDLPSTWLVDPQGPVSHHVTRSCGVTEEDVAGVGTFADHLPRLARLLHRADLLVGWNTGNDRLQLERALRLSGATYPHLTWVDLAKMFHLLHPDVGANP